MYADDFLDKKINERKDLNAFRSLHLPLNAVDFCSNDYLGIVHDGLLKNGTAGLKHGSTGSRLLTGNYALIEQVEQQLALFHQSEAALIFNSGYAANIGLLASVAQKGDTIIYDQLVHASIRDGIRLSFARAFSFNHNNLADLQQKLQQAGGEIFVVTESVFSMDGDTCPLNEILHLTKTYKAHLIIDEAHALGVIGLKGEGLAQHLQVAQHCFARVYAFGKACGCHGAVIAGSQRLRHYLINFARSFIFSTALPELAIDAIQKSYELFAGMQQQRAHLQNLVNTFGRAKIAFTKLPSQTPVQGVRVAGNTAAKMLAAHLQKNNLDVRPILYPTVPKGGERLRIVLHSFNKIEEVNKLTHLLAQPLAN